MAPRLAHRLRRRRPERLEDVRPIRRQSWQIEFARQRSEVPTPTSAALTAASAGGSQRGAWSLSMITALIPS